MFCCEFCEIFKNMYSVEIMRTATFGLRTATFGLINSCETSKWLLYTYYHIFVECWGNSLPCFLFTPVSLYAFDFKFYVQGYFLIKSIVAPFSTEVVSWMPSACSCGNICCCCFWCSFKALTKAKFYWINLFSTALLKSCSGWSSSRLTGLEGGLKMLWVFDTSAWFTLPPRIQGEAVLLNL